MVSGGLGPKSNCCRTCCIARSALNTGATVGIGFVGAGFAVETPTRGLTGTLSFGQAAKRQGIKTQDARTRLRAEIEVLELAMNFRVRGAGYFFSLSLLLADALARLVNLSNVFAPNASGLSMAALKASETVIASNCNSVEIFF